MVDKLELERQRFEAWAKISPANKWFQDADTEDGYVDGVTNVAFHAFCAGQAAINSRPESRQTEMKTIKPPHLFQGICWNCGAVYEASREDLKVEQGTQHDPGEYAHALCPHCKQQVTFEPQRR